MSINMHGQWSDRCELCSNSRMVAGAKLRSSDPDVECPWCQSVRLRYGSYFYPIDDSNKHLFKPRPVYHAITEDDLKNRLDEAFKKGAESQLYYGA